MWPHDDVYDAALVGTRADGSIIEANTKSLDDFKWLATKQLFDDNGTQGIAYQWLKHLFIEKQEPLELGLPATAMMVLIAKTRQLTPARHLINRRYNEDAQVGNLIYVFERFDCNAYDLGKEWLKNYLARLVHAAAFAGALFDLGFIDASYSEEHKCFVLDINILKQYNHTLDADQGVIILNNNATNGNCAIYRHPKTQEEIIFKPTVKSYQEFYVTVMTNARTVATLSEALYRKGLTPAGDGLC